MRYKGKYQTFVSGRLSVLLIEGVRLIGGPLNRGFAVFLSLYYNARSPSVKTLEQNFWVAFLASLTSNSPIRNSPSMLIRLNAVMDSLVGIS